MTNHNLSKRVLLLFILVIGCLGCLSPFLVLYRFVSNVDVLPPTFCTEQDSVYQTFFAQAQEWDQRLLSGNESAFEFHFPDGQNHTVFIEDRRSNDHQIVVVSSWAPRFRFGKAGYIYTPSGVAPYGSSEDKFTQLSDKFYCYYLADPG
jgi:hypothetical protein